MKLDPARRHVLTYEANGRLWKVYGCAKRGCDAINLDYEGFGARDGRSYCLDHVPFRSRLRLWWQEFRPGEDRTEATG